MRVLEGLKPERVFYYFEELTKIPRGSRNCRGVSDYCVSVAESLGLEVRQDDALNVVIKKPASEGYGPCGTLIIQGHMDMVCVSDPGVDFDFEHDALDLAVDDGYVYARGTSLGSDDGIAVAMALAILEDDSIAHPDLEVVITTEEEIGMDGADALDTSDLKAKYLINLDSEDENEFLAGCAGGCMAVSLLPMERTCVSGTAIDISIDGLVGGHSGSEIDKCQANANVLLGHLLYMIHQQVDIGIIQVEGGLKDNAIPVSARASIVCDSNVIPEVMNIADSFGASLAVEYRTSDPGIRITAEPGEQGDYEVFSMGLAEKVIFMLMQAPNGVQTMSADLPGLVESSLNLGILRTTDDGVRMEWCVRSSVAACQDLIKDKLEYLTEFLGGEITFSGDYPAWPYNPESSLCSLCRQVYQKMRSKPAVVNTIHAGLECGLFIDKMPGLDAISFGPNLLDIHTSREKMDIASVQRTYELLLEILKEFGDFCK